MKVLKKIHFEIIGIEYKRDCKSMYRGILQSKFEFKLFKEIYKRYPQKYRFKIVFQNVLKSTIFQLGPLYSSTVFIA
jgi:hypothetical protein